MKKRVLAFVLSTAMISSILAGCGSSDATGSDTSAADTETEAAADTESAAEDTEEAEGQTLPKFLPEECIF